MKSLFGLLLAVALAAGAATLVIPHPSAATPILADYSGASYLGREPINLQGVRLARVRHCPDSDHARAAREYVMAALIASHTQM